MRYQGETAVTLDAEARWGLTKRWWLVAFAGAGWTDAGSAKALADSSVHSGGFGGRYLLARALGLQAGLDVAKGPEQWAAVRRLRQLVVTCVRLWQRSPNAPGASTPIEIRSHRLGAMP